MRKMALEAICTVQQASKPASHGGFAGLYLGRQHYRTLIKEDTVGVLDGHRKFVFLRSALNAEAEASATKILNRTRLGDVKRSNRRALRNSFGDEGLMGYFERPKPRVTAPTLKFPTAYFRVVVPLCMAIQNLMGQHWPQLAQAQQEAAATNGPFLIGAELGAFTGTAPLPLFFSTATLNRNVICPSHVDGANSNGVACISAFGSWTGAELCFPRLQVAFDLQPGDVLIADTVSEQHGNVGPLAGTRISIVAYLRKMS